MSLLESLLAAAAARARSKARGTPHNKGEEAAPAINRVEATTPAPSIPGSLDEIERVLALPAAEQFKAIEAEMARLTPDERQNAAALLRSWLDKKWLPQPGPQTMALTSEADITLYGGSGGGGKSDTLLGLAFTQHKRTRIMRREFGDLEFLAERAIEINRGREGYTASPHPVFKTRDGRKIEFAACGKLGDEHSFQGRPVDLLAIDEAAQFLEIQIRYLMGWVRSTDPNQRCRVVLASNPPLSDEGSWLIAMFRPWLDPHYGNPAKAGELRWFITNADGDDEEVAGPGEWPSGARMVKAMSRTFIPARLADNAYLARTEYAAKLDALPEPLRSAIRDGNFMAAREDNAWAVFPSAWVRAAQARWLPSPPEGRQMTCIAADVAQGGSARTVFSARHGNWFAPLVVKKGSETPDGKTVAMFMLLERRDGCQCVVDIGGGWGGATVESLKNNEIPVIGYRGADNSSGKSRTGQPYANKRAQDHWELRDALDPANIGEKPALPPDEALMAELSAIRYDPRAMETRGVILIEDKRELAARLGRSCDLADAVIMAHANGGLLEYERARGGTHGRRQASRGIKVKLGHASAKRYG